MKTLIIYDTTGYIISQMSGSVREPKGIPFIWVEIPEGKQLDSVDVSTTPNTAIFKDIPKTKEEILGETVSTLSLENADLKTQIQTLSQAVAKLSVQ